MLSDNAAQNALHWKISTCKKPEVFNCRKIRKIRMEKMRKIKFWISSSKRTAKICITSSKSMLINPAWKISFFVPAKNRTAKKNTACASKKVKNADNFAFVSNAITNKSTIKIIFGTSNSVVGKDTRFTSLTTRTKRNSRTKSIQISNNFSKTTSKLRDNSMRPCSFSP